MPDKSSPGGFKFETGWPVSSAVVLFIVGLGTICLYGGVPLNELEFARRGAETDATVLEKSVDYHGGRNSYNRYSITYRFTEARQTVVRTHRVPVALWENSKVGAPLKVVYAPSDPSINRPVDASPPLDELFMLSFGVLMGAWGAAWVFNFLRRRVI